MGLIGAAIGAFLAFYGVRFIRDKSGNYRFTKGITLLGLATVFWGTLPQAQRFHSGTQVLAQLIVGLVFFGVGGAVLGLLIDWYKRRDNGISPALNPRDFRVGELDSKPPTNSVSYAQPDQTTQSKAGLSDAEIARLEQITSLRDRGTLSQFQFETERSIILGTAETTNLDTSAAPENSPPPPPPPTGDEDVSVGQTVSGASSTNGLWLIALSPIILIALLVVAISGSNQATTSGEVANEPTSGASLPEAEKCADYVDSQNWNFAFSWCSVAAENGDASSQVSLGYMYDTGKGVAEDKAAAVSLYRKAANQGLAEGQTNLGTMYEYGDGVKVDLNEALSWYRKAADQGNGSGQAFVGSMYQYGKGVAKDLNEAVNWYRKSADQGNAAGQVYLAWMYETGTAVAEDKATAVRLYRKAAEQGNADAQNRLKELGE